MPDPLSGIGNARLPLILGGRFFLSGLIFLFWSGASGGCEKRLTLRIDMTL